MFEDDINLIMVGDVVIYFECFGELIVGFEVEDVDGFVNFG